MFAIFGGAGDLTWRKLVPALFDLAQDRSLPEKFAIMASEHMNLGELLVPGHRWPVPTELQKSGVGGRRRVSPQKIQQ